MCDFLSRKEGDHEFMNIVSNEIADEVVVHFFLLFKKLQSLSVLFLEAFTFVYCS